MATQELPTNARAAKVLSHPLRAQCLRLLVEREMSPNEIAGELGVPLPNVSYHVSKLLEFGSIELVREARRRGAIEHYYAAVRVEDDREGKHNVVWLARWPYADGSGWSDWTEVHSHPDMHPEGYSDEHEWEWCEALLVGAPRAGAQGGEPDAG